MTLRSSLARYIRGLLDEPIPITPDLPTPSPSSTPSTTTPSTTTTNVTSEAALFREFMETMVKMNLEMHKETRELVISILQGRGPETNGKHASSEPMTPAPSPTPYDPPDYDAPGTDDLPEGIQAVFSREDQETTDLRHLQTENDVLRRQRAEFRARLMDQQGPASEPY